ncbi:MAG: phosphoglycerate dehydrogenase [Phycisphaeraceae bacterium]|nr:MAG: phosphoglycerate dehydrogenase [Phycisphaeraceae bacterium]
MTTSYPKDKINVVLLEGVHDRGRTLFESEGFRVESHPASPDPQRLREILAGAHVLGIRSKTHLPADALAAAPRLLAVGCFCIGTDQVDLRSAASRGIPVFNSPFGNTRSVAELTVAEAIALHRRLTVKSEALHRGAWDKSAEGAHEVRGRTLGIVGYGHIGSQVSVLAEAMGMRVVYYDVLPKLPLGNARPLRSLGEVLEQSDVVTLHVPATASTERMIGAAQLARMKPGAFLINNARGSVVDVPALASALREGRLGGAASDVFPVEPSGKHEAFASELCGLSNVILTPHIGGSTAEAQASIAEDVATKLLSFVNRGSTTGSVNVPEVELPDQPMPSGGAGARPHRVLHFHRNVPGVLSTMHGLIARLGANVSAEYLRTKDEVGYVVLDVDPTDAGPILAGLREIPETIRVRVLW